MFLKEDEAKVKANDVKEMLSEQDIFSILFELGGDPINNREIVSRTCCHNPAHEGKHKLTYYPETKSFYCFSNCGSMDIFGVVSKSLNLDFYNSFKYVCEKFGISYRNTGPSVEIEKVDTSFIEKFKKKKDVIQLSPLPKSILNTYYDLYHYLWINDGISVRSMKKFDIKFSIGQNQIIIPHFDSDGNLIGVRARNLNEQLVEDGKKYMPVYFKDKVLKHPTGSNLFGLSNNKDAIKKYKTAILVESEKSVLQLDSMLPDMSIAICISGSSLTGHQLEILKDLGIEQVVIAMDKEFEEVGSKEEKFYKEKITNVFLNKLTPYFKVSIIWDTEGLLDLKDSPMDKGLEAFQRLWEKRIFI